MARARYAWEYPLIEALLESDLDKGPKQLSQVEQSIRTRVLDLADDQDDSQKEAVFEELLALYNALGTINALKGLSANGE